MLKIRDDNVVYRHYQDIGIAIGGGKGLVVPVLRNVERMSFADIERSISEFARQAGENRLQPADLMGGTFTISNGGIYGSLLSTPIVNPPQSGILGLHSIQDRADGRRRQGRDSADDVRRVDLRSSHRRRTRSGRIPANDQRSDRRSRRLFLEL